jgi:hypothetical protein
MSIFFWHIKNFFKKRWPWIILVIVLLSVYFFKIASNFPLRRDLKHKPDFFGVTFSTKFSDEIGLDWQEVYLAILDDLQVKEIRLPIYWDEIEKEKGVYEFSDYDYIFDEGEKRGVNFIVNIGWRLPRWPECHAPSWASKKSLEATQGYALEMLEAVVERYKDRPNIVMWQLENEPFLDAFGVCPPSDEEFFKKELALLKSKDSRLVMVSAPGEISFWNKEAKYADVFGTTVYRVVWGKWTGYIRYPVPAWSYRFRAFLNGINPENRYIVELQAEPWVPKGNMIYLPENEARKSFNIEQFKANLQYAINIDFQKSYLWGVEWWYHQYKNGNKSYWELARTIF